MTSQITFNPYVQTGGNNGLFNTSSVGLRQGTAFADPSTRFRLRAGVLAAAETLPMWGGVGVYASVPYDPNTALQSNPSLGTIVGRATALTGSFALAGFSVFDEAYGMVTSPQSPVPLIGSLGQVNWYPLGSLARIAVECDPALISLQGGPIGAQVSWDFTNQLLVPFLGTLTISSGTYSSVTGLVTLTMSAPITFDAGDSITIASITGSGANISSLNGTYTAIAPTSGSTVTYQAATGLTAGPISGGNLTVGGAASQALPCKVLDVQATNCEVVSYAASTGFATWNYNGCAAVLQI